MLRPRARRGGSATTQPLPASTVPRAASSTSTPRTVRARSIAACEVSRRRTGTGSSTSRPTASTCAMTSARSRRSWTSTSPSVLMLDSLRSLTPGLDENDSKDTEAALRPVVGGVSGQRMGIATLILHHAGKSGVEYRGSTAIGSAVELGFTMSRHDEDPEKQTAAEAGGAGSAVRRRCRRRRWIKLGVSGEGRILLRTRPSLSSPREKRRRATTSRPSFASTSTGCHSGCQVPRCLRGLAPWHPRGRPPNSPRSWGVVRRMERVRRALKQDAVDGVLHRGEDKRWHPLGSFFERNGQRGSIVSPLLKPADACRLLQVSRSWLYRRVRSRARSARSVSAARMDRCGSSPRTSSGGSPSKHRTGPRERRTMPADN